jgi:hypothetical protein
MVDNGYYGVTVVTMETTQTIGILANVDCYNSYQVTLLRDLLGRLQECGRRN